MGRGIRFTTEFKRVAVLFVIKVLNRSVFAGGSKP
jgi:hypothetical protein